MSHTILIVDDDDDFRSLLTDLFAQGGYGITSESNPVEALRKLSEQDFDLCVTDQSMPELKGADFIDRARKIKPDLPFIMVSAYLNEDLIERLREKRIEVFHKPLNIMSLLRKTAEMIKQAKTRPITDSTPAGVLMQQESNAHKTNSAGFLSFSLKSDTSKKFKREIESIGKDMPNMVLSGEPGSHFQIICKDIENQTDRATHHFVYLNSRMSNIFDISKMIAGIATSKTLVVAVTEVHNLGDAQKQALLKLQKKTGPFAGVLNPVKFIFCLNEDLDAQFAKGVVDEDFYLILGQKEIYVPQLNLCKEDIPDMALGIAEEAESITSTPFGGFEPGTHSILMTTLWHHNYAQLRDVVLTAVELAEGRRIGHTILNEAIKEPKTFPIYPEDLPSRQSQIISNPKVFKEENDAHHEQGVFTEPRNSLKPVAPRIFSFPNLDDESDLARSILARLQ